MSDACPNCNGEGWVCENHPAVAWQGGEAECCGGAGAPCHICNPCTREAPPRMPPGFVEEEI